ncbi:M15 family metallopeptidase [Methylomonas koyamae]|uniref:M15 family metallopeptidase n=1 Tax=Methylomonas koyamae TaxID=702114 RepID=UPI0006D18D2C|nr:M15 family metallopeptidase [Methylomonas koyamae]BBL58001.1 peptidase [Methylomonas koyamae]
MAYSPEAENSDPRAICRALGIAIEAVEARGLRLYPAAERLAVADVDRNGRPFFMTPAAGRAWQAMKAAAAADGVEIYLISAYRGVERQAELIRAKLDAGVAIGDILTVLAPPGYSEHHTGRAVDLTCPDAPAVQLGFELTAAFAWLQANAGGFGFVMSYPPGNASGYRYEPWHWCFREFDDDLRLGKISGAV